MEIQITHDRKIPMRATKIILLLVLALAASTACTQPVDHDDGWEVGDDLQPDTGADIGQDTGSNDADATSDAYQVNFELVNNSGRPLYATPRLNNSCFGGGGSWLHVQHGGMRVGLPESNCSSNCETDDGPVVCDTSCIYPTREQYRLGDGEVRRYEWDATAWTYRGSCETSESMVGETLTAKFCYRGVFTDDSAQPLSRTCQTVEFTVDRPSQIVRVEIEPLQPNEVNFRMVNETGKDLYAQPSGLTTRHRCYEPWYTLSADERTVTPVRGCNSTCSCDQVEQSLGEQCNPSCPSRGACQAPTADVLLFKAGSERIDTWDGLMVTDDSVDNQRCERRVVPLADELTATMCYAEELDRGNGSARLIDPTCKDITFERTTGEAVELRLE
jgi:hypothetical protein